MEAGAGPQGGLEVSPEQSGRVRRVGGSRRPGQGREGPGLPGHSAGEVGRGAGKLLRIRELEADGTCGVAATVGEGLRVWDPATGQALSTGKAGIPAAGWRWPRPAGTL